MSILSYFLSDLEDGGTYDDDIAAVYNSFRIILENTAQLNSILRLQIPIVKDVPTNPVEYPIAALFNSAK